MTLCQVKNMTKPMRWLALLAIINLIGVVGLFATRPAEATACGVTYLNPPTLR